MIKKISKMLVWVGVFFLMLLLSLYGPTDLNPTLKNCYTHLCINLFLIYGLWSIILLRKKIDILEPLVLVTVIHILLFEIVPIICLYTDRILFFGKNVWAGCVKGTYISTLGYFVLVVAYLVNIKRKSTTLSKKEDVIHNKRNCLVCAYVMWTVAFICNVIVIVGYGLNLKYLITGGQAVMEQEASSKSAYGFLVVIAYAMIPAFLYVFELGKNKIIKCILFYLMFMSFYVRGFRFIMVAVLMAPFIYWYLKKNKRPNVILIVAILVALSIFSGYVQMARESIRLGAGGGMDLVHVFNVDNVSEVLIANFEIFKTYYAIVEYFSEGFRFTLGAEILLYTAILFVPRAIWSAKPQPPIYDVVRNSVNMEARTSGTSFPYMGEYYFEFGTIGVCAFSFVLGRLLKKLKSCLSARNVHSHILYASVYPLLLQVMIRGYTPTNFYMIVAVVLPVIFMKKIVSREQKK